jgi:hypothetical protein
METQTSAVQQSAPARRRPYFLLGTLILFLGIIIYMVQVFAIKHLVEPWHVPILGTIGVLLMLVSVVQRPGIWRIIGLVIFVALAGFEWFIMLGSTLEPYAGPAKTGDKLPAFSAKFADGSLFTTQSLEEGKDTVLVFNRGHW